MFSHRYHSPPFSLIPFLFQDSLTSTVTMPYVCKFDFMYLCEIWNPQMKSDGNIPLRVDLYYLI